MTSDDATFFFVIKIDFFRGFRACNLIDFIQRRTVKAYTFTSIAFLSSLAHSVDVESRFFKHKYCNIMILFFFSENHFVLCCGVRQCRQESSIVSHIRV